MRLPLYVHYDYNRETLVCDATHVVVCRLKFPEGNTFANAVVRKFNKDWRFRLFQHQPYAYTRQNWLEEKNAKA